MVTIDPNSPPTRPDAVGSGTPEAGRVGLSRNRLLAYGRLWVQLVIAQVAMALGDIEVLGQHPLAFLTAWGQQLQQDASNAFIAAQAAEATANNANTTAAAADAKATTALGHWLAVFDEVPGGATIGDYIEWLLDTSGTAGAAETAAAAATALANTAQSAATAAQSTATTALNYWLSIFSDIPGVTNITQYVNYLGGMLTSSSPLNPANLSGLITGAQLAGFDASKVLTGTLASGRLPTITPALTSGIPSFDNLVNALGIAGNSYGQPDLVAAFQTIPGTFVQGPLGGTAGMAGSVQGIADALGQSWQTLTGTAVGGLGNIGNAAAALLGRATTAQQQSQVNSETLANRAVSKPAFFSTDRTADVVFPLPLSSAPQPLMPVTQNASVWGVIGTPDGGLKKAIKWLGKDTANVWGMWLAVYRYNTTTGAAVREHTSPNIISTVSNVVTVVNAYNLPDADWPDCQPDEYRIVEMRTHGPGTYQIVGYANTTVPIDTSAKPSHMGGTRAIDTRPPLNRVGAAASSSGGTSTTANTSITIEEGDYLVVESAHRGLNFTGCTVRCNGVAMTALGTATTFNSGGVTGFVTLWGMATPTVGENISITATATASSGGTTAVGILPSTYRYVSTVGAVTTANGTGTAMVGGAAAAAATGTIVHGFGAHQPTGAPAGYSGGGTARGSYFGVNTSLLFGDAAGTGSAFNFTATGNGNPALGWGSVSVVLNGIVGPAPETIANPVFSTSVPHFSLTGAKGRVMHAPESWQKTAPGTYTYNVPSWVQPGDYFDIALCGCGAGGYPGAAYGGNGNGGGGSTWNVVTLRYGDGYDIPTATTSFTVTVGSPGLYGIFGDGSRPTAGGNVSINIAGYGTRTALGAPVNIGLGAPVGGGPGNATLGEDTYYGGPGQYNLGGWGNAPGGSGAGGNGTTQAGGPGGGGALGLASIIAYRV